MPKAKPSKKSSAKKSNIFVRAINKFSSMHKPAQVMVLALVFGLIGGGGYAVYSSFAATPSSQAVGNGYLITGYYSDASYSKPIGLTYTDPYSGVESKMQLKKADGAIVENVIAHSIVWSPTSYKFFIHQLGTLDIPSNIYVSNYNGTDTVLAYSTKNSVLSINWSPDGTKLAFLEYQSDGRDALIKVIDTKGALLQETAVSPDVRGLAWNVSGTKIFTGVNDYYNSVIGREYDLATKALRTVTYDGSVFGAHEPLAFINDSEVVLVNIIDGSKAIIKYSLATGVYSGLDVLPGSYQELVSNNKTWVIGNSYSATTLKLINVSGTTKEVSVPNCPNIARHAMFSPDSKKILFGCSQPYLIEKSYDIATGAITNLPKTIFADSVQQTAWQPGVKRVASKTCTSGSFTMKSDLTFYGLSAGKRVMNPLVMTPQISGKTQSKKVEYKITVQTLKDGVWTTKQVIGPTTASTTGAVTLNPVDQLEYSIVGTKVIVSSGVAGDSAGNCSVTHYSS